MKTERRAMVGEVRLLKSPAGTPEKIVGYAAVYDSRSQDLGGFVEIVRPGAFTRALASRPDVLARYNHEQLLGRTINAAGVGGTLQLSDDSRGLRYEITVPDTTVGRDVAQSIDRGDVRGSSFCFRLADRPGAEEWRNDGGTAIRELRDCDLFDVGPVDQPAYLGTEGELALRCLPETSRAVLVGLQKRALMAGTPNLWQARLKMAEAGVRFYVESDQAECALADACQQAANACDSVVSLSWKMDAGDALRAICVDCLVVCGALARVVTNPDSAVAAAMAGVAGEALKACAKACKGVDHPICKLCAAVCLQAAEQCATMAE